MQFTCAPSLLAPVSARGFCASFSVLPHVHVVTVEMTQEEKDKLIDMLQKDYELIKYARAKHYI